MSSLMQKYQITLFSIIIALSAFFQYSNTLNHNYVWDDLIVVTNNEKVKKGFGGIKEIFTEYDPSSEKLDEQYGYRPITLSSFALDVEIFGLNPYYGHLMSIIYFSILCVVLFLCLQMLFYSYSLWLPFFVTLLFVVHPIHVEVVANIKSRDEILALLFGLLALVTATKYIKKDKIYFLLMSVFSFILAILSKEHLTIFSLVIPFGGWRYPPPKWS